jgi:GT2 family glycosyltransferase
LDANKYTVSGNWIFKSSDTDERYIFLENQKKGKIIIDKAVKSVIESFYSHTLAEINQKRMVSRELLEIILKVFYRVGVLELSSGTEPKYTPVEAEIKDEEKIRERKNLSQYPLVSIVIINRGNANDDEGRDLSELVHSVYKQRYQNRETIIVNIVDIGTKSRNALWLKKQYPDIHILELKRKIGFPKALNKGIEKARGDFILVLNNTIVLEKNAVYEMMRIALSQERWSAISPKLKYYNNPSFIHSMGKSLFPYFGMGKNFCGCVDFGQFDDQIESVSASFSAALLNRKIINEIGMADPFYKFYYEDLDWCFRARVQGYPVFNAPCALAYYKHHYPQGDLMGKKSRYFRTLYQIGNRLYFVVKNLERKSFCRFLINYIAEDITSMLIHLKRKQFSLFFAYLKSYIRLIPSMPTLFFKRAKVQRKRKIKGDAAVLAKAAPFNFSLEENGIPKLDTHSLRTYYSFLLCQDRDRKGPGKDVDTGADIEVDDDDIIIWQERTATADEKPRKKLYFEFSFTIKRSGPFDIYLLGFTRRGSKVYLDNHRIDQKQKHTKKNKMLYPAARNIYISKGKHFIELERRNHVREIILRRSNIQ